MPPRRRMTTTQKGYGPDHQRQAAILKAALRDGDPFCRCGGPMYRWQLKVGRNDMRGIDADHYTLERALGGTLADALAHRSCNRRAGAALGGRITARGSGRAGVKGSRRAKPVVLPVW